MTLKNLDKKFLERVAHIFDKYGYETMAYDELGYLFSDYFMDMLELEYKKDPEAFTSLKSIDALKDPYHIVF